MEKGGGAAVLETIDAKASKSGKSINYWVDFKLIEGPYTGKILSCCFNSETENASLLGTLKFFPSSDLMKVKAAVNHVKFNDLDFDEPLDTDELLDKPFDLLWDVMPVDGDLLNVIIGFLPLGTVQAAPAF
jgi:hypothetical protein